jgi:hypothetical protein
MTKDERDYLDMVADEKRKTAVEDAILECKERERREASKEDTP